MVSPYSLAVRGRSRHSLTVDGQRISTAMFSENEIAYIKSQRLARLATVNADGQPDAVAVGFEFSDGIFYVGGRYVKGTRKYNNVAAGRSKVALVIDDLETVSPWKPRGIRIYGIGEIVTRDGRFGDDDYLKITPTVSWSWAVENDDPYGRQHKVVHSAPR